MNALIFTGGNSPKPEAAKPLLASLFAELGGGAKPFVIAADSGLLAADSFGEEPQLVIGDMDSAPKALRRKYLHVAVEQFPRDKDFSDTELALQKAAALGSTFNVLVGGGGGRIDHFLALYALFGGVLYPDAWLLEENLALCIDSERRPSLRVRGLSPSDAVSVFAVNFPPYAVGGAGKGGSRAGRAGSASGGSPSTGEKPNGAGTVELASPNVKTTENSAGRAGKTNNGGASAGTGFGTELGGTGGADFGKTECCTTGEGKTKSFECRSKGLAWQLDRLDWQGGAFSLSNRICAAAEEISLEAKEGRFVVVLPLKDGLQFCKVKFILL